MKRISVFSITISTILLFGCSSDKVENKSSAVTQNDVVNATVVQPVESNKSLTDQAFEKDMETLDTKLNAVTVSLYELVKNIDTATSESAVPMLEAFEDASNFILIINKNKNYLDSIRYKTTYSYFLDAALEFANAKVTITRSIKERDSELFSEGYDIYLKALELFKKTGEEYNRAYNL